MYTQAKKKFWQKHQGTDSTKCLHCITTNYRLTMSIAFVLLIHLHAHNMRNNNPKQAHTHTWSNNREKIVQLTEKWLTTMGCSFYFGRFVLPMSVSRVVSDFPNISKDIHQFETVHWNLILTNEISCTFLHFTIHSSIPNFFSSHSRLSIVHFVDLACYIYSARQFNICFWLLLLLLARVISCIQLHREIGFWYFCYSLVSLLLLCILFYCRLKSPHARKRPFTFNSRTQNSKWHFNWAYGFMTILCFFFSLSLSRNDNLCCVFCVCVSFPFQFNVCLIVLSCFSVWHNFIFRFWFQKGRQGKRHTFLKREWMRDRVRNVVEKP